MKKIMKTAVASLAAVVTFIGSVAVAQNGLDGALDDLLGIGDSVEPTVEKTAEEPAEKEATAAAPTAEASADAELDSLLEVAAEPKAEAPAVEEAAKAAEEPKAEAVAEVTEVAAAAEEAKESETPAVEEAAKAAEEPKAEAVAEVNEVASTAEEAKEAETPAVEEAAKAAEEPKAEAVAEVNEVASTAESDDESISEIATLEEIRRKALDEHGRASLATAKQEMANGNYVEAQRCFEEADKFLVRRAGNEVLVAEAIAGISEAVYRQAEVLYKRADYQEALKLARQARELNHKKAVDLIGTIQAAIENPPEPKVERPVKRWNDRDYRKNQENIKERLGKARQYYITGEYDKARSELELILKENPYEHDAIIMLRRVADRSYDINSLELNTTRATMIDAVRNAWTPDRYAIDVSDVEAEGETVGVTGQPVGVAGKTPEELTQEKMQSIVIPEINFKNASISDVIEFFVDASREFDDPSVPPEKRGVNLILKVAAAAPAEATVDENDPFAAAAAPSADNGVPPVTFSARFMSLWDGLQYACELTKLKFRIRSNTVMIMPINEADVDMVSRTYTVLPSIEERSAAMSSTLSARSQDDEGRTFFDDEGGDTEAAASGGVDWKALFADMGVKWPNGSSVKYLPSINKMRVLNTPENLVEFEKALQELNVTPRQVEIEARFVEVAQVDLESLGFEWLLTDNWEIAKNKNDNSQYIQVGRTSATKGNRFMNTASTTFLDAKNVDDALLSVSSVLTNPELGFVLHMLSQQANTDLLSAPKVVTMNGEEAIIKVVREYIYPTEYEIKENEMDSGDSDNIQVSYPSVEPQNFDMREVGVILQVVPQVSEDGQMISLQLNPQIISGPEWKDYGFDYPVSMGGSGEVKTLHLEMAQPIFEVRSVSTKISIYNGATVVMGGMITENRNEVNDKVPFLGDIPLIGRLFRSTYEASEKRNLLIFVTARMVDPAGRTLKTNVSEGPAESAKAADK